MFGVNATPNLSSEKTSHGEYPCPCGFYGDERKQRDRIAIGAASPTRMALCARCTNDIHIAVRRMPFAKLSSLDGGETSSTIRARVEMVGVGQTIRLALSSSLVYGLLVCALSLLIPTALISLFSQEAAIIAEGRSALQLLSLSYLASGISLIIAAYFQSVGKAKEALWITLGGILLVKLPVLLLASSLFSLNGIWISEAVSELLLGIVATLLLIDAQKKMASMQPVTPSVV